MRVYWSNVTHTGIDLPGKGETKLHSSHCGYPILDDANDSDEYRTANPAAAADPMKLGGLCRPIRNR
jgi:hypothetical protein